MKSIFKKIALVLAFAMVITMLPAKSASVLAADASANKWVRKTCTLYIDALEDDTIYVPAAYATAKPKVAVAKDDAEGWGTLGYSVSFTSADENVAVVGERYGLVEAVGIGQTTITATFTKKGAATVTESFPVNVKRRAASVALEEETEKAVNGLFVGNDPVVLKAVMTDADGNQELVEKTTTPGKLSVLLTEGRKYITDYLKFEVKNPEDKEVLKYDAEKNELTAVAEGTATLNVVAYRYDWKATAKTKTKYAKTRTAEKAYAVTVKAAGIVSAEQSAHNAFQIVFDAEATAKAAVDETSKYFTSASAAVTEKEDIVKVYEVLKNAAKEKIGERAVTIGKLSQRGNAKHIVDVTMFDELKQETDYIVRYKDRDVSFTTTKNVAAELTVTAGTSHDLGGDSSRTDVVLDIYAIGTNGQKVKITGCADYNGWQAGVVLEEVANEQYHPEYSVSTNPMDAYINFYTKDQKVVVTLKATFLDYFNKEKPGNKLENTTRITAGDHTLASGSIVAWGVHNEDATRWTWDVFDHKEFAAQDLGRKLFVKADVYYGGEKKEYVNDSDSGFTFRSANEDKLVIDEYTGKLFPAKEPTDEIVNVYVYFDNMYIGVCPVKVWTKRQLAGFTASVDSSQLSYNPSRDVDDEIKLTMKPVDQLDDSFTTDMTVTCEVYGNDTMKGYVRLGNNADGSLTYVTDIENGAYVIKIKGNGSLPANQSRSIRVLCTATYNDGLNKRTLTASAAFSAKNTDGATVSNYKLSLPTELDMLLNNKSWENGRLQDKVAKITAYSVDREGFKIEKLAIKPNYDGKITDADKGINLVMIQQGNDYVQGDNLVTGRKGNFKETANPKELTLTTVISDTGYIVSGSAISAQDVGRTVEIPVSGSAISQGTYLQKMKAGSYQVSLYIAKDGDSKPTYRTGTVIRIKDSQPAITWNWDHYSVDASVKTVGGVLDAIKKAFTFNKLDDDKNTKDAIRDGIYVGYVELDKMYNPTVHDKDKNGNPIDPVNTVILSDDIVVQGSSVAVKQVRYIVTYKEGNNTYYYETLIPINKSIWVGVTQ